MFRKIKLVAILLCVVLTVCIAVQGCSQNNAEICDVVFWHSYTGGQADLLSMLVDNYNESEGSRRGTHITAEYRSADDIETTLLAYFEKPEKSNFPSISIVDGELAYKAMTRGMLIPAENYLTAGELSGYFNGFLNEGRLTGSKETYIFPISKTSEILLINDIAWRSFSRECHVDRDELQSWDSIAKLSGKYYEWSGGNAFMAIESVRNFIFTYSAQRLPAIIQAANKEIKININKETLRNIWDFYYSGVVRGYILQTDNIPNALENGNIIGYIGAPRDNSFFPKKYKNISGGINTLIISVLQYPSVSSSHIIVPQNGNGAVVFDKDESMNAEAFRFLHWMCSNDDAVMFSAQNCEISSYSYNYSKNSVDQYMRDLMLSDYTRYNMLSVSVNQMTEGASYAPSIFIGYNDFCDELTQTLIEAAAHGREQVLNMIENDFSYEGAVRSVETDAAFENWYEIVKQLAAKY